MRLSMKALISSAILVLCMAQKAFSPIRHLANRVRVFPKIVGCFRHSEGPLVSHLPDNHGVGSTDHLFSTSIMDLPILSATCGTTELPPLASKTPISCEAF